MQTAVTHSPGESMSAPTRCEMHWLRLASEAIELAETMVDGDIKRSTLGEAERYERWAMQVADCGLIDSLEFEPSIA